ncbi:MAG TPA: response regulator [Roseiflexaceae bacterium]|nr:response regulator [Roseiflexaceae bacterium]
MAARPLILLAEDTLAVREAVDAALTAAGYDVVCASGGTQAYELLRRLLPDLAILDLILFDEEAGLDVLREMRSHEQTAHIPAIVYAEDAGRVQRRASELAQYGAVVLAKPFSIESLLAAVQQLLRPRTSEADAGQ